MSVGSEIYERLGSHTNADASGLLSVYIGGMGLMFQKVADISSDSDTAPGWSSVMDPDLVPADWIPWLGQFVGAAIAEGTAEVEAREIIKHPEGQRRGTIPALYDKVARTLTGVSPAVIIFERYGGDAYDLHVTTFDVETPDPVATGAAALSGKAAGLILTYTSVVGGTYDWLTGTFADYDAVEAAFTNYDDITD